MNRLCSLLCSWSLGEEQEDISGEGAGLLACSNQGITEAMGKTNVDHFLAFCLRFLDRGDEVGI
jgi:hypothetical protein